MKLTWVTASDSGEGHMQLQGAKKRPHKGEDLHALVTNVVKDILRSNKCAKDKAEHNSGSYQK